MGRIWRIAGFLLLCTPAVAACALAQGRTGDETLPGSRPGSSSAPQAPGGGAPAAPGAGTGVMTPPQVDPGMAKAPPQGTEFRSRVIPPPGSPGGDPNVQPR